jgi:hypothetical protein
MDIAKVFSFGWPSAEFTCGDSYESLVILNGPKPSLKEIEAKLPAYLEEVAKKENLKKLPDELDNIFKDLPVPIRAQFFPLKAAIKLALEQGDIMAALEIINMTEVPPELAPLKGQMLNKFREV